MDSFYNADAAAWARETVMKMDEGEAQAFVTAATHSILMQDIAANRRTIDGKIREIQKSLYRDASRVVSKGVLSPMRVIEEISKANGWDEDRVKRDASGKFSTTESRVRIDRTKRPMPKARERAYGIPSARGVASLSGGGGKRLTPKERAAYQQQYLQLIDTMDRYNSLNAKNIQMVLEDKATGHRRVVDIKDQSKPYQGWNPSLQNIVSVRASTEGAGSAAFDLVSALGNQRAGGVAMDATMGIERGGNAFSERWNDASKDPAGTNARTYRRIKAGSELLGEVSGDPKVQVAAKFGEFVGQFGPEAEKVVGPHMRKTAYRYRGTEKKPDSALISARNTNVKRLEIPEADQSVGQMAARRMGGSTVSAEQKVMASVQAATSYLSTRVPEGRLAEIQLRSGRVPPSEGVIIDKDGKIAVQASGFAEDHYLPFNLKNLGALKGGVYVRTRSKGGLTTEDIYTGLVAGARQVTVVSNSGVFTVDFEDDFRGVRRYNDKAASMVGRYAKTLDAIKAGKIERQPLDEDIQATIRDEVEDEYNGYPRREIEAEVEARVKEYRESEHLTSQEIKLIDAQAARAVSGQTGREQKDIKRVRNDLINQAKEAKRSRFYQLDGEGYAAALESLREQYPYYIKSVSFQHRRGSLSWDGETNDDGYQGVMPGKGGKARAMAGGSDKGYVKPRHNRPEAAQEGYYDETINGRGKQPASETNYQNWEQRGKRSSARAEEPKAAATGGRPVPKQSATAEYIAAQQKFQFERDHKAALASTVEAFRGVQRKDESQYPALRKAHENFDKAYADPATRTALEQEVDRAFEELKTGAPDHWMTKAVAPKIAVLRDEAGRTGGTPWTEDVLGTSGKQPYTFDGPGFQPGASPEQITSEVGKVHRLTASLGLSEDVMTLSDEMLRSAAAQAGLLSKVIREGGGQAGKEQLASLGLALGQDADWYRKKSDILANVKDTESEANRWANIAEGMERARTLKTTGVGQVPQAAASAVTPAAPPKEIASAPKTLEPPDDTLIDSFVRVTVGATEHHKTGAARTWKRMEYAWDQQDAEAIRELAEELIKTDEVNAEMVRYMFSRYLED